MQLQNIQITGGLTFIPEILSPSGDPYWANVSLLMNTTSTNNQNNNVFLDGSTNNFDITRNGTTTQGSFTPFTVAPNTSYNTPTNGGSGYFPGSATNNLTAGTTSSFNFLHNSSALFTAEFWIYRVASNDEIIFSNNNGASASIGAAVYFFSENRIRLFITRGVSASPVCQVTSLSSIPLNTWTHIAITYNQSLANSNAKIYINGVLDVTGDKAGTAPSNSNATTVLNIGGAATNWLNGYLSSFRIVNSIVYSSNFTPSTTPLTAIANTSLLLNFTNGGMYDAATKNNLLGFGDVKVSTTQSKFAPTSVVFDGTGDYITSSTANAQLNLASGDFTVELWFNTSSVSGFRPLITRFNGSAVDRTNLQYGIFLSDSTLTLNPYSGSANNDIAFTSAISTGTWYHVALVRTGNTFYGFLNGVRNNTVRTISGSLNNNDAWLTYLGYYKEGVTINYLSGYIQDVRVTKGVARYTAAFTPPTAPFPTN